MKRARGFSLLELVVVLAVIAAVVFMVTGRGEADAYERQVALNEAAKIRFFIGKGFAQARTANEPIEIVATGHQLMLRGARSGTVYDTLETRIYEAGTAGVTSTLYPSGTVTGGDCTLSFTGPNSRLSYAIQPGGLIREVQGTATCPTTLAVSGGRPSLPTGSSGTAVSTDPPPPPPPTELDPPPPPPAQASTGSLQVNIENPASTGTAPEGDLDLRDASGLIRTIDRDTLVPNLNVGTYTIVARPLTVAGCAYEPTQSSISVGVLPNDTSIVTVNYVGADSRLSYVRLNDTSTDEAVVLDRQGGVATLAFKAVGAKTATITATPSAFSDDFPLTVNDPGDVERVVTFTYTPNLEPAQRTARIEVGIDGCGASAAQAVDVIQEAGSAPLTLEVSGLPAGTTAPVHLESADARCATRDYTTGNATLTEELPATCAYRVWGERVANGGNYYAPKPVEFTLNAYEPGAATLLYELDQGYIDASIAGLPTGAPAVTVTVAGPVSKSASIAPGRSSSFVLPPGTYTVEASPAELRVGGVRYVLDNPTRNVTVVSGRREPVEFTYRQADALLTLRTSGLPSSEKVRLTVSALSGAVPARTVYLAGGASTTLPLEPGSYKVSAANSANYYAVNPNLFLRAESGQSYTLTFDYRRKTGTLRIRVDHHKAWSDGVGTAYGDGDSAFEYRDFVVPTGQYTVRGDNYYIYKTSAPQYRYRLISENNQSVTVPYGGTATVTMDYIIERRNRYCFFACWWGTWYKVGD